MEIIKSYTLYFNTREANIGTSSNCKFIFTTPIVLTNSNNRFLISTPMIELPYSFSQINTTNWNLPYTYTDTRAGGHTFTSTGLFLPIGNFNINDLQTQLITSLIANILVNIPSSTLTPSNFNFTYSPQTGKASFVIVATYSVIIVWKFSIAYVIGIMLGFPQVDITISTASTMTGYNKVMVNPITSVYLRSDTLKFETNYEAIVQSYQNSDILAKIPITTLPNSIIYYRNDIKSMISNKFLSDINLYLSDNLSLLYQLDMQGVNWGVTLHLDEVQLKPTNAYQDILHTGAISQPKSLIEERDNLMEELLNQKRELEQIKKNLLDKDVA